MREIFFRGKVNHTDKWVYGNLVLPNAILPDKSNSKDWVDDGSVGQFTGMYDKNGTRIFEGDIIRGKGNLLYEVRWYKTGWKCYHKGAMTDWDEVTLVDELSNGEIFGNRWDAPYLVNAGKVRRCMALDIDSAIINVSALSLCIIIDGQALKSTEAVREFLYQQKAMGRELLPIGDCDNFDYKKGCLGHPSEDEE